MSNIVRELKKRNIPLTAQYEERNYKKEYANYQGRPEQIARRSSRNKARRLMGDKVVKGMDVGHKDNNPLNNDPKNLKIEDPSTNRREPRLREDGHTAVAKVRATHKRDDERNKVKRDRELDRARTQDTARKNTQTRVRGCLLYTSPSPRDRTRSRMPSSA